MGRALRGLVFLSALCWAVCSRTCLPEAWTVNLTACGVKGHNNWTKRTTGQLDYSLDTCCFEIIPGTMKGKHLYFPCGGGHWILCQLLFTFLLSSSLPVSSFPPCLLSTQFIQNPSWPLDESARSRHETCFYRDGHCNLIHVDCQLLV